MFQRFISLDQENFKFPSDRSSNYTIIELSIFEGRSIETKKYLIHLLYEKIGEQAGIEENDIEITIFETPMSSWGIRGVPGDELVLNYKVRYSKNMYAVIFRAEINEIDDAYSKMAAQMRDLAKRKYGCIEFTSVTEGGYEISISYWKSLEQITQWKNDVNHTVAQELGFSKWYKEYQVQVVEIIREYKKHNRG